MSAESSCTPSQLGGHVIAPQPVSDRSIIESVAGFINDVVPQGYSSVGPISENKELITWARFEFGDINDPALYPDTSDDRNSTAPLLLVLGYGNGVQVWAIPASGEATEVLSWRQGVVRTLRVLPTPPPAAPPAPDDLFVHKRPLVAICDSTAPGPQFCALSFISLRSGDQVKSIKFKNSVNDVLANRHSVVVSFHERIAVFDAATLEDRMTITTCYPSPGPNPNPVALGSRWMAYAERRLIPSKRCSGGTEGEGIQSYTATVLHAAKSLGKGLRELGETVASSLTGGITPPGSRSLGSVIVGQSDGEVLHPGIVMIVDAQGTWKENGRMEDNVVAHFTAHGEAIVALRFDPSGVLLATADRRGHDFHLFRVQPHPGGSPLAAVHHLYVLHRGDTTAKVQDIAFAGDSRWVAVSTLRGTTHVFPITPYGGAVGLRTHSTPHVVNRLSRFHRSAGLTGDGRNSPQPTAPQQQQQAAESQVGGGGQAAMPYPNPRLPPYPHPTVVAALAQIRQPVMHLAAPSSPNPSNQGTNYHRNPSVKALGRNQSSSEESSGIPLRVSACFAPSRAWLVGSPTMARDSSTRASKKSVDSLFVMACHGNLIEYDLETKHATGIPKEKICDDTPIELEVVAKAQWQLLRPPQSCQVQPPLPHSNPLMVGPPCPPGSRDSGGQTEPGAPAVGADERWLSHVEIVTHAGPHRRLWMGPQFTFKTYTANASAGSSLLECEGVDVGSDSRLARSNPVNMPLSNAARQSAIVPFLIESGSGGSLDQSPHLMEVYGAARDGSSAGPGETQLREELADAMMESPGVPTRDTGRRVIVELQDGKRSQTIIPIEKIVNPVGTVLTVITDEGAGDGRALDGEPIDMTVRWPSDVVKVTPKLNQVHVTKKRAKAADVSATTQITDVDDRSAKAHVKCTAQADEVLAEVVSVKKRGKTTTQIVKLAGDNENFTASKQPSMRMENEASSKRREHTSRAAAKESTETKLAFSIDKALLDSGKPTVLSSAKEKMLPASVPLIKAEAIPCQVENKDIKKEDLSMGNKVSVTSKAGDIRESFVQNNQVDLSEKKENNIQDTEVSVSEKRRQNRLGKLAKLCSNVESHLIEAKPLLGESPNSRGSRSPEKSEDKRTRSCIETNSEILSDQSFRPTKTSTSSNLVDHEDSFESAAESFVDCAEMESFSLPTACVQNSDQISTLPNESIVASARISDTLEHELPQIQDISHVKCNSLKYGERVKTSRLANGGAVLLDQVLDETHSKLAGSHTSIDSGLISAPKAVGQKSVKDLDDCTVLLQSKNSSVLAEPLAIAQVQSGLETDVFELKPDIKAKSVQVKVGRRSKALSPGRPVAPSLVASPERRESLGSPLEIIKPEVTKTSAGRKAKRNESKLFPSAPLQEPSVSTQCGEVDTKMEIQTFNASLPARENQVESTFSDICKTVPKTITVPFANAGDAVPNSDFHRRLKDATTDDPVQLNIGTVVCSPLSSNSSSEDSKKSVPNAWGNNTRASLKKRTLDGNVDEPKPNNVDKAAPQILIKGFEQTNSVSSLENVRLSPVKSWSSIASGKKKLDMQPAPKLDDEDLVDSIRVSRDPLDDKLTTDLETLYIDPPDCCELQADIGTGTVDTTDETVSSSERLIQVETFANEEETNNESEIQSSLQASKKNRKKNKKRR